MPSFREARDLLLAHRTDYAAAGEALLSEFSDSSDFSAGAGGAAPPPR